MSEDQKVIPFPAPSGQRQYVEIQVCGKAFRLCLTAEPVPDRSKDEEKIIPIRPLSE